MQSSQQDKLKKRVRDTSPPPQSLKEDICNRSLTMVLRKFWKKIKRDSLVEKNPLDSTDTSVTDTVSSEFELGVDYLKKTHFPDFDSVPETELSSQEASDDDSDYDVDECVRSELSYTDKLAKYKTKEDQDVAVFLALADRMSMESLLHLLQGHVRAENLDVAQYADIAKLEGSRRKASQIHQKLITPKAKHFRWAEVTNGRVRETVKEVENLKSMKSLWWKPTEMRNIQQELVETVQFFRRYRHDYIESVEVVAQKSAQLPEHVVEGHMKNLTKDCYTRGLEAHIVKLLSENRKKTVKAVLEEQSECTKDDYEVKSHCLREQSLAYSKLSTTFASKMGKCDEIIALKANLSSW